MTSRPFGPLARPLRGRHPGLGLGTPRPAKGGLRGLLPLLSLTALLCLSCALSTPAAAQADSLAFTRFMVCLTYDVPWPDEASWIETANVIVFDPKGGDNISCVRAISPAGAVKELTPETTPDAYSWTVDGDNAHVNLAFPASPAHPQFGSYQITAENFDGDSVTVSSQPTDHVPDDAPAILWPPNGTTVTDTQPTFYWEPAPDASPYPITYYGTGVDGPSDEFAPGAFCVWQGGTGPHQVTLRFNYDGSAGVPELTPGTTYCLCLRQWSEICLDPGGDGSPAEYYRDESNRGSEFTIATSSLTSFEEDRYPWAGFAAGPDEAAIWREPFTPEGAHSATFAMQGEADGEAITGLRLALPVGTTQPAGASLHSWAYVPEWTGSDSSCFFGFTLSEDYPDSTTGWSQAIGWEALSATQSNLQLGGSSLPLSFGLPAAGWHLVRVNYHRAADSLRVWLDGVLVADEVDIGAAGQAPHYAVLGALGQSAAAQQSIRFDDVSITPMLDIEWPEDTHLFGRVEGLEQVVEGQQYSYEIRYGNAYPVLGAEPLTEELTDPMYVGVTLPPGYSYINADPLPDRVVDETVVWELPTSTFGQHGYLYLEAEVPTGLAEAATETLYLWATDDPGADAFDPPNPPDWTSPYDATWGCPQDVLPQAIFLAEDLAPDLWVRKDGPRYASPGDTVNYAITVGNRGLAPATEVEVRDLLPELLGGDDVLLGEITQLDPGDTWRGVVGEELPWGVEHGTLLLNEAYVSTAPAEVVLDNNESLYETTVLAAHDPNQISVSPEGTVAAGDTLTYTVECENTGAGTAYAVYVTMALDPNLDDETLVLPAGVSYLSGCRLLLWPVGTLASESGASTSFTVEVADDASAGASIIAQAIVYFPSVPEVTPTNIVVNVVNGIADRFPDVPPEHWAFREIEACAENGVVGGYGDGSYQPTWQVTRGQMAVFIARALVAPEGEEGLESWTAPATPTFPDVNAGFWAYKHVEYLKSLKIVGGYDDGLYRATARVTRDQMAAYISRAIADPKGDEGLAGFTPPATPTFPDVPEGQWAYTYIEYAAANGVVQGYPYLDPQDPDATIYCYLPGHIVTRCQMAVYVARAFDLMP